MAGTLTSRGRGWTSPRSSPEWTLKVVLAGMDTAKAFQSLSGQPSLRGKASGELQLTGTGVDWAQARASVTGGGSVQLRDGALTTADVGAEVVPVLTAGLGGTGAQGRDWHGPESGAGHPTERPERAVPGPGRMGRVHEAHGVPVGHWHRDAGMAGWASISAWSSRGRSTLPSSSSRPSPAVRFQ
nr:AsmA-like C-terminal region-containing protein [Myxococcus sp. AB036A]